MIEIGSELRAAREAHGLTLEQVEQATRIRARFLWALEEGEWEELGGLVYARGFLRNYALFLNLDPEPLLAQLDPVEPERFVRGRPVPEPRYLSQPLHSNPIPTLRLTLLLLLALVVGTAAYLVWYQPSSLETLLARAGLEVPPITASVTQTVTPLLVLDPEEEGGSLELFPTPTPAASSRATPVPTATLPPRTPTPNPLRTATPVPTATALPSGVVVVAQIVSDTWVRVFVDAQTAPVVERVLRPGESFEWVGEEEVALRVGNAAGISVTLNGEDVGPLGGAGEVREFRWRSNPEGGLPILVDPQG